MLFRSDYRVLVYLKNNFLYQCNLPRILLRSVFSSSGFSRARRLRSSLVQMMKAFKGLLTRGSTDLASVLEQLESEFTECGLEGPEPGDRTSVTLVDDAAMKFSLSNIALVAHRSKSDFLFRSKYMVTSMGLSAEGRSHPPPTDGDEIYALHPPIGGQEWIQV